jgi:hypothetical protein
MDDLSPVVDVIGANAALGVLENFVELLKMFGAGSVNPKVDPDDTGTVLDFGGSEATDGLKTDGGPKMELFGRVDENLSAFDVFDNSSNSFSNFDR